MRHRELEHKFGTPPAPPRGMVAGFVHSPIESKAADKMNDDQWLKAIAKYKSDARDYFDRDPLKGGASELALMLKGHVEKQPERFARLALRFPPGTNTIYYQQILEGLKTSMIATQLKFDVVRKVYAEFAIECGATIADLLGGAKEVLSDDAVGMLAWLATEHPDPKRETWLEESESGGKYYGGDVYNNGINTTRGRAAEAIRDLIENVNYLDRFRDTLNRMVQDKSAAVLSCVASTLRAVARHDTALALALFQKMNISDDRLLASLHMYEFILGALRDQYETMRPYVERMLQSNDADVCEGGACLAAIAGLENSGQLISEIALSRGTRG